MYFFLKYIVTLFYKKLKIKIVVYLLRESGPCILVTFIERLSSFFFHHYFLHTCICTSPSYKHVFHLPTHLYFTPSYTPVLHLPTHLYFTFLHLYFTFLHTCISPSYTPVFHLPTHLYLTSIHTCTSPPYTPVFHLPTHLYLITLEETLDVVDGECPELLVMSHLLEELVSVQLGRLLQSLTAMSLGKRSYTETVGRI